MVGSPLYQPRGPLSYAEIAVGRAFWPMPEKRKAPPRNNPTMNVPDTDEMIFWSLANLAWGFWIYRWPEFVARFFWLTPFRPNDDPLRLPPSKFVAFFRILGLITMWAILAELILYLGLRVTGVGVVAPEPPAI